MLQFREIQLDDKETFQSYFQQRRYDNAHFNFTNLFMWRNVCRIRWAEAGEALFLRAEWEGEAFVLPPICRDEAMPAALEELVAFCEETEHPLIIRGIEATLMPVVEAAKPGFFNLTADRDNFDYVYEQTALATLAGRRYHGKKNHLNQFLKNNSGYEYAPLTPELVDACEAFTDRWCAQKGCEKGDSIDCERQAIHDGLQNMERLGFVGGVILLNGQVEAYSFGEKINEDTAVIHVEKANGEIRGLYAAINWEFCRQAWEGVTFINREEDMGEEGLRKAKESYHPVVLLEKYVATPK